MVQDLGNLLKEYGGYIGGVSLGAALTLGIGIYQRIRDNKLRARKTEETVRYTHVAIEQIPEEYRSNIATIIRWRISIETPQDSSLVDSWTEAMRRLPEKYHKIANELTGELIPWLHKYKPDSIEEILQEYNL